MRTLYIRIPLDVADEAAVEDEICEAIATVSSKYPTKTGLFGTMWMDEDDD